MKVVFGLFCLVALGSCAKEISVGGQSYFVEPALAQQIAHLPDAQKLARIQRSKLGDRQRSGLGGQKEISIHGKSYFVEPSLVQQLAGLNQQEQLARIHRLGSQMMGSPMMATGEKKEISIGGKSYFVDPLFTQQLAGLNQAEQLARIQRTSPMAGLSYDPMWTGNLQGMLPHQRSGLGGQKEISIHGKSYFVEPSLVHQLAGLSQQEQLARIHRLGSQMMGSPMMATGEKKEISIGGKSYFVDPLLTQQLAGLNQAEQLARIQRTARSLVNPMMFRSYAAPSRLFRSWRAPSVFRMNRGLNTQNLYEQQFNQERVIRTPISKTVTVLPNEVTRITRNIKTHMPMVHERVRNIYNIEDINKKRVVHHFVEPVQNKYLGTRRGRAFQQGTQHRYYRNRMYQPRQFVVGAEEVVGDDVMLDGQGYGTDLLSQGQMYGNGEGWKVLRGESCAGVAPGQAVRPKAVCMQNGAVGGDAICNDLPFPKDIIC